MDTNKMTSCILRIDEKLQRQIQDRIQKLLDSPMASTFMKRYGDPERASWNIRQLSMQGTVRGFYMGERLVGLLAFDVFQDWWTNASFLLEVMVLKLYDDRESAGVARSATRLMERLAHEYDASAIVAGCMFMKDPTIVTNSYKGAGFDVSIPQYVRVLGGGNNDS